MGEEVVGEVEVAISREKGRRKSPRSRQVSGKIARPGTPTEDEAWRRGPGAEGRRPDGRRTSGTPGPSTRARSAAAASGVPREARATTANFDPAAARELPETFRQHAWHCLLEMSNATQNPERWSYGVTSSAQQNINATFADISDRGRGTMLVERHGPGGEPWHHGDPGAVDCGAGSGSGRRVPDACTGPLQPFGVALRHVR